MVKIALSYFYQIRNFKPYMVPVSTAAYDPKWYHNFGKMRDVFVDKNGVINGLRYLPLVPGESCKDMCHGPEKCIVKSISEPCNFLKNYKEQLSKLDVDRIIKEFENIEVELKEKYNIDRDIVFVLMVYEKPDNPCSERNSIIEYFNNSGYPLEELNYPISDFY